VFSISIDLLITTNPYAQRKGSQSSTPVLIKRYSERVMKKKPKKKNRRSFGYLLKQRLIIIVLM
jgi:hypothetical protein